MQNANDNVLDDLTSHGVDLLRFESHLIRSTLYFLKELEKDLLDRLENIDPTGPVRTVYQEGRLKLLLAEVRDIINSAYSDANRTIKKELRELSDMEIQFLGNTYNALIFGDVFSVSIAPELLKAVVEEQYVDGELIGGWVSKQKKDLAYNFRRSIRQGMILGEPLSKLVQRIRGIPTAKRTTYIDSNGKKKIFQEYEKGIMSGPLYQMNALIRTAVQSVANDSMRLFYEKNVKYFKGWQAVTTLDFRTSDICISRSNAKWDMEGNPIGDTLGKFPGFPPWHWNCRSKVIGIIKSFEELGLSKSLINEVPEGTRASFDGEVAESTTYSEWLKKQSTEHQKEKLGPTKYKLWKDGKLKLNQLLDQFGRPLSIQQIKDKF